MNITNAILIQTLRYPSSHSSQKGQTNMSSEHAELFRVSGVDFNGISIYAEDRKIESKYKEGKISKKE